MSEMDRACMELRAAIGNPFAVKRYLDREKTAKELWENFRKAGGEKK